MNLLIRASSQFHAIIRQVIPLFPQLDMTDVNPRVVNSPFLTRTPPPAVMTVTDG